MMRRVLWVWAVWTGLLILSPWGTIGAAELKIGVIDTERVLKESRPAKDARAIILEDLKAKSAFYSDKQEKVKAMEEELRREKTGVEDAVRRKKADELAKEIKELQRLKSDLEEELNKKNAELTQRILKEIGEVVKAYSKEKKFTLILERKNVVLAEDRVDITEEVIRVYDKRKSR